MFEISEYPIEKNELYSKLYNESKALFTGETHPISNMANLSSLLYHALPNINWVGFYLTTPSNNLLLGPFHGKPACIRIPFGKGVCGTAIETLQIQRVADVHNFKGHIACDSASRSEIVIPLLKNDMCFGVLDVDSPLINRFEMEDQEGLNKIVELFIEACDFTLLKI